MAHLEDDVQDLMGYEALVQEAMQGVMRKVLMKVSQTGFPDKHHLYIVFKTSFPGVLLPKRLLEKFPDEMTIVLQNQFWDLEVTQAGFSVSLAFGGIPEKIFIPFLSVKTFFDPAVSFGLQFKVGDIGEEDFLDSMEFFDNFAVEEEQITKPKLEEVTSGKEMSADQTEEEKDGEKNNVLDLDAFRHKRDL